MADISKIKLPTGNVYDLKDAVAREMISGIISYTVVWYGKSVPVVSNIPAGVQVEYNGTTYTGTKSVEGVLPGSFFLVKSGEGLNSYNEYFVTEGAWELMGTKEVDLSNLGELAYKDSVTLNKGTGDIVLGEGTTFTNASSAVTFSGGTTDKVLGADTTFSMTQPTVTVTPATTNIQATASGTAVGADGTATFVKSYPGTTSKLATTTVPNVTSAGSASTWSFAMGTGNDAETLIISGANGSAPTLGTAKTVATGSLSASGSGGTVMTGLGTATTGSALTGVKVTSQPSVSLATSTSSGTGKVSVVTGITSASATGGSVSAGTNDQVTAVTGVGTGTAAAQTITVGTNDKVTVAKHSDLSVSVN